MDSQYSRRIHLYVWFRDDDTPAFHQLQASKCGSFELENNDLQGMFFILVLFE